MKTAILLAACLSAPLAAAEAGLEGAWARATAPGAQAGAVFGSLRGGDGEDRLVRAACAVADVVELHTHVRGEDGVMRMRPVEALAVPAGGTVLLKPGAEHIMLIGLKRALVAGERLPLLLTFARAGQVAVVAQVGEATANAAPAAAGGASAAAAGGGSGQH